MKPPQKNQVICGSNLEVVKSWPANCISAIVTDPPYGIGFMGKDWDTYSDKSLKHFHTDHSFAGNKRPKEKSAFTTRATAAGSYDFSPQGQLNFHKWMLVWAQAMLRITKPGGFLLCFGGTRTYHRLACAIEDAGWEIRDCMMWLYGSGFPKSHNISKAIDKAAGAKREVIGVRHNGCQPNYKCTSKDSKNIDITNPATNLAQLWDGYGTALKPAWEPIIVAMKPLGGTFAHNAEKHGVAGLNIDGSRIGTDEQWGGSNLPNAKPLTGYAGGDGLNKQTSPSHPQGRWPANLILDEEAGKGESWKRYFYCPKTSRKERNMGMEDCEDKLLARSGGAQGAENRGEKEYLQKHIGLNRVAVVKNNHPTVKPLALMKYLCTLLKMPSADQIILDPFLGSGTTGMACKELGINFIGIEKEREYCEISIKRIAAVSGQEITLHTETPLPVTKNVETFRTTTDFAGGSRRPNENLPCVSEHRQRIINAAVAALRRNQK